MKMGRCHLDSRKICDGSCIAFDYKFGCRLKSNEYSPTTVREYVTAAGEFDLKEI